MKALLSASAVISASGWRATAACMFAACCSIEPSFCVNSIWQLAWILAQASSKPFFTDCQNGFDADEWCVNTIRIGVSARAGAPAQSARANRLVPSSSFFMDNPPLCLIAVIRAARFVWLR